MKYNGEDQLVIGGFPEDASKEVREKGANLVRAKIPQSQTHFDPPTPLYATGRICAMTKKAASPWAVMNQAVDEYKQGPPVAFKIHDKEYTLGLGLPTSPERRKRNQILRMLAARAEEQGASAVEIDWWSGDVLSQKKRIASMLDGTPQAAQIQYVKNPYLNEQDTGACLSEQQRIFCANSDWQ